VTIRSKNRRDAKLVKDSSKKLSDGIKKLKHWNRCVEVVGDYVEK
jgi:hypothetical protein